MKLRDRKIWILVVVALVMAGLLVGIYVTSTGATEGVDKKDSKITVGKNWEIRGEIVKKPNMPSPKKNLKRLADPAKEKDMIDQRPQPSGEGLKPVSDIE